MGIEERLKKLEFQHQARPGPACRVVEIRGMTDDGKSYLLEIRELDESGKWVAKPVTEDQTSDQARRG